MNENFFENKFNTYYVLVNPVLLPDQFKRIQSFSIQINLA